MSLSESQFQNLSTKEKLRLRGYGIPSLEDKVYLEIKKKVNGLVNKRRTRLVLKEAYNYLFTSIMPEYKEYMNKQVLNEIDYFSNYIILCQGFILHMTGGHFWN